MIRTTRLVLAPALLLALFALARPAAAEGIAWQSWSDDLFERARREKRLVLLDLGAVWCHWCHVMEETTYANPQVIGLLARGYLPVKVDQDARPDLANRYEDYGWPATVIFHPDGRELAKLRGYLPPERMISLLQAFLDDPTPGPSVQAERSARPAAKGALADDLRAQLSQRVADTYDREHRGWGSVHKYLPWDCVEWCLVLAGDGDEGAARRARETLEANLGLIDPVWGGVYQYSHGGVWSNPHFEKIMQFQGEELRLYSLAYRQLGDPRWLKAAQDLRRYLRGFLTSPEGAFYVSQDADVVRGEHAGEYFALGDAARRAKGIPRIDTHRYARENGWAIQGLVALHQASGDAGALDEARRAAEWVKKNRALPDGGFRHDEKDAAGPYLGDTLAMARAFVALYEATAERGWLADAEAAARFADRTFRAPAGYVTARAPRGAEGKPFAPRPQNDENVAFARLAARLAHFTGDASYRAMAEHALRLVAGPDTALAMGYNAAGVLLADREAAGEPVKITVVGGKDDGAARALFAAAQRVPAVYTCIEWLDPREGPLRNPATAYPAGARAAAYVCAGGACSAPIEDAGAVKAAVEEMNGGR